METHTINAFRISVYSSGERRSTPVFCFRLERVTESGTIKTYRISELHYHVTEVQICL